MLLLEVGGSERRMRAGSRTQGGGDTNSTTFGAMTLHGPHQTAKQSTTITPGSARAFLYSSMLYHVILADILHRPNHKSVEGSAEGKAMW